MERIKVLMADDNRAVRREFRNVVEFDDGIEVVGEAKNGRQAVAMATKLRPAVVLMDLAMPLLNGIQATIQILELVPGTKVLMLSAHSDDGYVEAATNAGAMGYLVKQTCADKVALAIREVQKGNTYFSPSIASCLRKRNRKTPRE